MKEHEDREKAERPAGSEAEAENAEWDEEGFFRTSEADEAEDRAYFERKAKLRKRLKKGFILVVAVALLANGLAFWPMLYNLQAIRFLAVSRELSRDEAVSGYKQAVVSVSTGEGKGTGFLVSEDGYVVTNEHVTAGKKTAFVKFSGGATHEAEVVVSDASVDLAVLKLPPSEDKRTPLPVEREPSWQPGEHVYVIGNPLFFDHIANEGTVLGDIPVQGLDVPAMVLDAPIYKGNSGSPVINERGEAIAVVFATAKIELSGQQRNVGLAVPAKYLVPYLVKLAKE